MRKLIPVSIFALALAVVAGAASFADRFFSWLARSQESELITIFAIIGILFILSFIVFYVSSGTPLPSFVVAIFFGVAAHNFLSPILEHKAILGVLVGLGATLILFGGGLETPYKNFKKLFWKIFSLSFPGLIFTALALSLSLYLLADRFGQSIDLSVVVLLGAILSSTDPAAIIPILRQLRFKNRDTKDIIISESAVTDVTGTLITVSFLSVLAVSSQPDTIWGVYKNLISSATGFFLIRQIFFGVLFGFAGYYFLELLKKFKKNHAQEFEADSAFFLFVPIIIFTVALAFGGSGYLAAFVAGLLFHITENLQTTEKFFNHIIDGFFKPTIFILLGAIVDVKDLIAYAPLGIAAALFFMFVIRPLTVFIFLGPFSLVGKNRLSWRDLLFISAVRETGAIPAVLLVTVAASGISSIAGLVPIGMWVILLTLIVEPALTPFLAKKLSVADPIKDSGVPQLISKTEPVVVLVTRGYSFLERLSVVVAWANRHAIKNISVLLCLEDQYSPELEDEIKQAADPVFERFNKQQEGAHRPQINFEFLSRKGFLQNNVSELAMNNQNISVIFVGRKMLDYRPEEIKQLTVPLFFIE